MIDAALLDVYDAACLAGGLDRVVDTAVVGLVESGQVRAQRTGELTVVDPKRRDQVEAAVLYAIGTSGRRTVATVRMRAGQDQRLVRLADRLVREGLLSPSGPARRLGWRRRPFTPTVSGRRALRQLRADPPHWALTGQSSAGRVALDGVGQMADRELRAALFDPHRPERSRRGRWAGGVARRARTYRNGVGIGYGCGAGDAHSCGGGSGGSGGGCGGGCGGGGG